MPREDGARFRAFEREGTIWVFDALTLELRAAPEGEGGLEASIGELSLEPIPPPVRIHTRTRVSNLKLDLSDRCPSACAYCFRPRGGMPRPATGLIRRLVLAMVEGFGRDARSHTLTFNLSSEPLADLDQLEELIEARDAAAAASGKPIEIYLCTSATVQGEAALDALSRATGGRLAISVDGPREAHDRHRRDASGAGTYDRVLELAGRGRERGMRLEAQAVLTADYPYPHLVAEHLLDLGFSSVTMKPVRAGFSRAFSAEDLPALEASYDAYFSELERELAGGRRGRLAALKNDFALRPLWKLLFRLKAEGRCFWGSTHIVADATGSYYPCDAVAGRPEFRCGSVDEGVDWERFHADVSWRVRKGCPECWARTLCGGTCYVSALALAGDHLAHDPAECALSRYFAEKCLGLAISMLEAGEDPYALRGVLLGREAAD
jgi:uncharacterized protein